MERTPGKFAHRFTRANRFESICLRCFRTAGSATREEPLREAEAQHVCQPEDLLKLTAQRHPSAADSHGPHKRF